jgi:hypothetical protein
MEKVVLLILVKLGWTILKQNLYTYTNKMTITWFHCSCIKLQIYTTLCLLLSPSQTAFNVFLTCIWLNCIVNSCPCFSFPGLTVAHCDAGVTAGWNGSPDLINDLNNKIHESIEYAKKEYFEFHAKKYPSELKPLFSAFGLKNFSVLTLRSFLLYYLPLIQPQLDTHDEEDDDMFQDNPEEKPVDLITPFHNSVKQIIREASSLIFLLTHRPFPVK